MIYFTSDTHFWHRSIIDYCKRPWDGIEAMNAGLIDAWNSKIQPDDEVWFLGDFAFAGITKQLSIFEQLAGRKHLIRGNHDGTAVKLPWLTIDDYKIVKPGIIYEDDDGQPVPVSQKIVLCHYPILSWDSMHHGSWHLHGHCHGNLRDNGSCRIDVGVDPNGYLPLSLNDLKIKLATREVVPVDHHI